MNESLDAAGQAKLRYQRLLVWIVVTAVILIGVAPVLMVASGNYDALTADLDHDARSQATLVSRFASTSPDFWMLRVEHIEVLLQGIRDTRFQTVIEKAGQRVIVFGEQVEQPSVERWADLEVHGQKVGRLGVVASTRSLRNEIIGTTLAGLVAVGLLLALLRYVVVEGLRHANESQRLSEQRLRDLIEVSSDWFWEQDAQYRFVANTLDHINMAGLTSLIGKQRWELPIKLSPEQWAAHRDDLHHRRFFTLRYPVATDQDEIRWFEVRGKPVMAPDGSFAGYRGIGRDITREIAQEQEVIRHRDHLQEMVDEQVAEVVRAKQAAEAANAAKSEFLANISHELRTPMHAVLSFAALGLSKANLTAEKTREYFKHIGDSGDRLMRLLNDLLDLSKMEAGMMSLRFAQADLAAVVSRAIDEFSSLAEERRLQVDFDNHCQHAMLEMDPMRIGQLITNLLANALRFGPPGTIVTITLEDTQIKIGRRRNDQVEVPGIRVTVSDEGPGIPEAELESIFGKFNQSSLTKTGAGGTGLGLAISRDITRLHCGTITAGNRESGGAVFELVLPRRQPVRPAAAT